MTRATLPADFRIRSHEDLAAVLRDLGKSFAEAQWADHASGCLAGDFLGRFRLSVRQRMPRWLEKIGIRFTDEGLDNTTSFVMDSFGARLRELAAGQISQGGSA